MSEENRTGIGPVAVVDPAVEGDGSGVATQEPRPEGEEQVSQALGGLRGLLELDFSDVEGDPNRYKVRKLKGKDLKAFRLIVLKALDKVREIREQDNTVYAENEPAREQIRTVAVENAKRMEKGEDLLPMPNVVIKPEPESGLAIGRYLLSDVLDELLLDEDSWLASLLDGEEDPDDLDLDWYLCVIEKVVERDDFPNLLARHLRIYQVFSNALRTKQQ